MLEKNLFLYQYAETTIGKFETVAAENPNDTALIYGDQEVTYAELNSKADAIAKMLVYSGIKPKDLVAIAIERSVDMVAGLLGIWKSGAGYVPLCLEDPKNRLMYLLQETQCQFVLTKQRFAEKIISTGFCGNIIVMDKYIAEESSVEQQIILPKIQPEDIAYVLYTSGSTGKPKGVVVEHRGLWEFLWANFQCSQLQAHHRFLQLAPYTFDASLFDLYLPLICRVIVVLPETENNYDLPYLADLIIEKKVNYLKSVPSFLRVLTQELKNRHGHSLHNIYSVGEELLLADVQRFHRNTGANIYNQYGPTESVGFVSMGQCLPTEDIVTLGYPIANVRLYVLDEQLNPVPPGAYGELYISKHYLAKKYLRQEELTASRFILNPFMTPEDKISGYYSRLYQTGDKVRWLPDGRLQFGGRRDFQVKINGHRIEPGEIEAIIAAHWAIKATVVTKIFGQLYAFVVLNEEINIEMLRAYTAEYLPAFMVPAHWIILSTLPVTQTGKVDRKLLPSLVTSHSLCEINTQISSNVFSESAYLCTHILHLLKKILPNGQLQLLHPDQNFFKLGMDSLRLLEFSQALRKLLNIDFNVQNLFRYQTPSALAQYIFLLLQENKCNLFQTSLENFLISLHKEGSQLPLFVIPGGWGEENEILVFMLMMSQSNFERPIYGIRSRATDPLWKKPKKLSVQAHSIFKEIKKVQPNGPYYFLGECLAHPMALELAKIAEQRENVSSTIILLDSEPLFQEKFPFSRYINWFSINYHEKKEREKQQSKVPTDIAEYYRLLASWKPVKLKGELHLICSSEIKNPSKNLKRWKPFFKKKPHLYQVKGDHMTYIRQESEETVNLIRSICLQ